jgi:hypothetical protein
MSLLRGLVRGLDAVPLSPAEAVELVGEFAEIERLGYAGKTLAAGRVADTNEWRSAGDRSAADWLATQTGSTVGDSRECLRTASKLVDAPGTDEALRAGSLSAKQAEAIAPAAAADPSAESRLLHMAKYQSLQKLRDECARVQAAADPDPKGRHERIRRNRFWRRWTRSDGSRAGMYAGTPEEVALFEAHAQPFLDERIDEARRGGESEPSEAYAFDGLLAMGDAAHAALDGESETRAQDDFGCDDEPDDAASTTAPVRNARRARGGRGRKRISERRELLLIADLAAWRRGLLLPGETCEIPGIGSIPIEVAHELFGDALLRIVLLDGVDVSTVVHTGRTANTVQETAVIARQRGRCGRPPCGLPISEIDHTADYADTKHTTFAELLGLCGRDHDLKTNGGHSYRREVDGSVTWIRPDGTEERERPPPPP